MKKAAPLLLLLALLQPAIAWGASTSWHRLVGILQYLEADYPLAVETGSELEMEEQRAFISDALEIAGELGERASGILPKLEAIRAGILRTAAPEEVSPACASLIEEIVGLAGLSRSPRMAPDLASGERLFAAHCAACHGVGGGADVAGLEAMDPPPTNFLDPEVMEGLSPYRAFNTIRFGIPGTAMPPFPGLGEEDRWALAFFLPTLRLPPCEGAPPEGASLEILATSSDGGLAQRYGETSLACLRRNLPRVDEDDLLSFAVSRVEEALRLAEKGDRLGSRRELLDAYLLGIEPLEPRIRTKGGGDLVLAIESRFLGLRAAVEGGSDFRSEGEALLSLLEEARKGTAETGLGAVFWVAMLIILREGFEAVLVVGALLAVLRKMGEPRHARVVHAGWISALVAGVVAFWVGRQALAGANREWLEGIAALVAVAMLLYHIVWLSSRAHVAAFMKDVRGRMEHALGRGSIAGLFSIAFLATFRESFETVLFMQGLSIDSIEGVAWGSAAGLAALGLLVALIYRVGFKLPLPVLFRASSILLFATAVVLLGKGLRALQEVGAIPLRPLPIPTFDLLGIFPDLYTFLPQALLALSPLVWGAVRRRGAQREERAAPGL